MIELRRNSHQMNGEHVEVLEVWRCGDEPPHIGAEMILVVPLNENEQFRTIEPGIDYLFTTDREKQLIAQERLDKEKPQLDVMTEDGRKQVAENLLNEWSGNQERAMQALSEGYRKEYQNKANAALAEILQLMGIDS